LYQQKKEYNLQTNRKLMDILQGKTVPFSIDLATLGVIDSVTFEVFDVSRKKTWLQYKYPATTGYGMVEKTNDVYSFTITSDENAELLGKYGVEMTWVKGEITDKSQCEGLDFIKQAK